MPEKPKRLAVIDRELCNPKATNYACRNVCPINRSGQDCVTVSETDTKPLIDEDLCIGCGICAKKCDRKAITVVNLPAELDDMPIHRYGKNLFSLYRLPFPKKNAVVGLIGPNGVGKSTVLNIMSGQLMPNTGILEGKGADWKAITDRFAGTELQDYLEKLSRKEIAAAYKPQHVDAIPRVWKGKVSDLMKKSGNPDKVADIVKRMRMEGMLGKEIKDLSGGELQRVAIAATMTKDADFYFFDEPSSYLDAHERLMVAKEIRRLSEHAIVMVIEHDLAVADYLADFTHILYGKPGVFGVVSKPYGVRIGINTYLEGYIREENMKFRPEPIVFSRSAKSSMKSRLFLSFPAFRKDFGSFSLKTEPGNLYKGEVIGILGPNGIGKTTFIRMLSGELMPDSGDPIQNLSISYKPQRITLSPEQEGMTVDFLVRELCGKRTMSAEDRTLLRFLGVEKFFERIASSLSGGELQSAFVASTLLKDADIFLLDEPSAFLDVEQRLRVAKLVRDKADGMEKPFFVVDHDLQFIDAVSDRVMVFSGEQGVKGSAMPPCGLSEGMNSFLSELGVTYRRDPHTGRPRANKPGSQKDSEQKASNQYYYAE